MKPNWGLRVYGLSALSFGALGLWSRDFAAVWQPVPKELPGRFVFACVTGLIFLTGGALVQTRSWRRPAGLMLAGLYLVFAALWMPRVFARPLTFATWAGVAEQLALVAASVLVAGVTDAGEQSRAERWGALGVFGVCSIAFGFNHFFALKETAALTPAWLPPGAMAWAIATGVFHVAAGVAILAGRGRLAARMLTVMYAGFGLLVWAPALIAHPESHVTWAGNVVNLALVAAAWVVADALASPRLAVVAGDR